jgi:hypothetical protein
MSSPDQKLDAYSWRFTRNVFSFSAHDSAVEDCFDSCSSCDSLRQSRNCMNRLPYKYTDAFKNVNPSRHHVYGRHIVTVCHNKVHRSKHQSKLQSVALRISKLRAFAGYYSPVVAKSGLRLRNELSCEIGRSSAGNYDNRRCGHTLV